MEWQATHGACNTAQRSTQRARRALTSMRRAQGAPAGRATPIHDAASPGAAGSGSCVGPSSSSSRPAPSSAVSSCTAGGQRWGKGCLSGPQQLARSPPAPSRPVPTHLAQEGGCAGMAHGGRQHAQHVDVGALGLAAPASGEWSGAQQGTWWRWRALPDKGSEATAKSQRAHGRQSSTPTCSCRRQSSRFAPRPSRLAALRAAHGVTLATHTKRKPTQPAQYTVQRTQLQLPAPVLTDQPEADVVNGGLSARHLGPRDLLLKVPEVLDAHLGGRGS